MCIDTDNLFSCCKTDYACSFAMATGMIVIVIGLQESGECNGLIVIGKSGEREEHAGHAMYS